MQNVCCVFDSAVGSFMQPMFAPSVGAVVRSYVDEVNRKESPMYAHPDDYVLWHIADFNPESGVFVAVEKRVLARGKDVKRDE